MNSDQAQSGGHALNASRQAILDFLNEKKPNQAEKPAQAASKMGVDESLKTLAALGLSGLGAALAEHPLKQSYDQIAPLAQVAVRRYPWWAMGLASAAGALLMLSPGARRQALRVLKGENPLR